MFLSSSNYYWPQFLQQTVAINLLRPLLLQLSHLAYPRVSIDVSEFLSAFLFLQYAVAVEQPPLPPPTLDEVDTTRHREIMSKAVSAILLLTLKWFKVSREYGSSVMGKALSIHFPPVRRDEIPFPWTSTARVELSSFNPQDVHDSRSSKYCHIKGGCTRKEVGNHCP